MLHGWIILDKPVGLGSTQAVSAVKRVLREAGEPKTKVGHGGTLDPLASGVLPSLSARPPSSPAACSTRPRNMNSPFASAKRPIRSTREGEAVATSDVRPTLAQLHTVLPRFTGEIEQIPPAYSALKIGGKAAYARARAGEASKCKPRSDNPFSPRLRVSARTK